MSSFEEPSEARWSFLTLCAGKAEKVAEWRQRVRGTPNFSLVEPLLPSSGGPMELR